MSKVPLNVPISFSQLLSSLIVSGNGQKIPGVVGAWRQFAFSEDPISEKLRRDIMKKQVSSSIETYNRVGKEMYSLLIKNLDGVPKEFLRRAWDQKATN